MNHSEIVTEITALKARYFRYLDNQQWDKWAEVFTEDFKASHEAIGYTLEVSSRDEMVETTRAGLEGISSVHHGHMPEITVLDENTVQAVWAMEDRVETPEVSLHGFGHYHETYRRINGEWKIQSSRLDRLPMTSFKSKK